MELMEKYQNRRKELTKSLMQISVAGGGNYHTLVYMTPMERELMIEALVEKMEAQNPKKSPKQTYM